MKCIKHKSTPVKLVLRDDVCMHEFLDMMSKSLVGRFMGRRMGEPLLNSWFKETWELVLEYMPNFYILVCGWMGFIF
jgi:hypothetical protein